MMLNVKKYDGTIKKIGDFDGDQSERSLYDPGSSEASQGKFKYHNEIDQKGGHSYREDR